MIYPIPKWASVKIATGCWKPPNKLSHVKPPFHPNQVSLAQNLLNCGRGHRGNRMDYRYPAALSLRCTALSSTHRMNQKRVSPKPSKGLCTKALNPTQPALCESYHVTAVLTIQHPTRSSPGKRKTNIHFISFYKHFMSFGVPYPGWGDGVPMASLHNLWSSCRPCHGSGEENHHLSGTSPAQKRNRWTLNKLDPCWTSSTSNLLIFVCLRVFDMWGVQQKFKIFLTRRNGNATRSNQLAAKKHAGQLGIPSMWAPPVIRWFISPINYSYRYHKP